MSDIDPERRASFDRDPAKYDAARPSYPQPAVDAIIAASGAQNALEVGAGTGKATVAFARRGLDIVALEPGPRLAAFLRDRVARLPHVEVVESTFEAYEGDDFDLVYAAQSFHWIDPAKRYVRAAAAVRRGGALALLANEKAPIDPVLRADLDAAYARHFGWPPWNPNHLANTEARWTGEIDDSGWFSPVRVSRFPWQATYTSAQYIELVDTYSDHALQPENKRLPLYDEIRAAIDRRGGTIEIPYVTLVWFALRL